MTVAAIIGLIEVHGSVTVSKDNEVVDLMKDYIQEIDEYESFYYEDAGEEITFFEV